MIENKKELELLSSKYLKSSIFVFIKLIVFIIIIFDMVNHGMDIIGSVSLMIIFTLSLLWNCLTSFKKYIKTIKEISKSV